MVLRTEAAREFRRCNEKRFAIVTSQVPIDHWYDMISKPTLADAILDRLVHIAYRIELSGESLRKQREAPSEA